MRITVLAHDLLAPALRPGAKVLDATLGNGHDALYLAQHIGEGGELWGVDCQASAVEWSRQRLRESGYGDKSHLYCARHRELPPMMARERNIPESPPYGGYFAAIVANLGYLPGGDHEICTQAEETVDLLRWSLHALEPGGRLVVCVYTGHPEGQRESQAIEAFAAQCEGSRAFVMICKAANRSPHCPWVLLAIRSPARAAGKSVDSQRG